MGFGMIVLGILGLDGWIKRYVDKQKEPKIYEHGCLTIKRCRNKGAAYEVGKEHAKELKIVSIALTGGVLAKWYHSMTKKAPRSEQFGYSLLVAGCLSNLWDRIKKGYVVDYIHVAKKGLRKIVFNIADVCIVVGGCIVCLWECFRIKEK